MTTPTPTKSHDIQVNSCLVWVILKFKVEQSLKFSTSKFFTLKLLLKSLLSGGNNRRTQVVVFTCRKESSPFNI